MNRNRVQTSHADTETELVFRNLDGKSELTADNEIALADLIYDTDPYIYPAMFGSRENAEKLLPLLFRAQDSMFRPENFFVAFQGERIIALLLWKEGRLSWTPQLLKDLSASSGIPLSPYLDYVAREYVEGYGAEDKASLILLINLCVADGLRGRGTGRMLMERFIERHADASMELCALAENKNAVRLYKSLGFEITERYVGFSVDQRRPDAIRMQRRVSP